MIEMKEKYLTPDQLAEAAQVSSDTILRLLRSKELKGFKIGGQWRIAESAWEKYIKEQQQDTEEEK